MSGEEYFYILMQTSSTVVAGVDDDTFLQIVFSQDVRINIAEACIVHALYMYIAEPAARQSLHLGSPASDPSLVEQVRLFRVADWQHRLIPLAGTSLQAYQRLLAPALVEQLSQVGILSHRLAIDGGDDIAHLHLAASLAERPAFQHGSNLHSVSSLGHVIQQSQLGSGIPPGARIEPAASMAHIQFTQQLAQHLCKVIVVVDMRHESGIVLHHHLPVAAVIVLTEYLLVHLLCHMAQHVFALCSEVELHLSPVGDGLGLVALL